MIKTADCEVAVTAACLGCGWGAEGRAAVGEAKAHATDTDHKVVLSYEIVVTYNAGQED
jgi:hypothetical protein